MTIAKLRALRALSIAIIFTLTLSLADAQAGSRSSKGRKPGARAASKSVKKSSRGRSSKSKHVSARRSKKGRSKVARSRGRNSRWRRTVARSTPTYHRTGIHNFLTDSWTNSQTLPRRNASEVETQSASLTPEMATANASVANSGPVTNAGQSGPYVAPTAQPDAAYATQTVPLNPLVAAYADSLSLRGFEASNQGFIVTTMSGEVLAEHNADRLFNPASVVKVATSLVAISKLGADFRFHTSIYTDGALDPATGILHGSLYVVGSGDPAFFYENALLITDQLNNHGIRSVEGNLVVLGQFYFNFSESLDVSARALRSTLTPETWGPGARGAYTRFLSMRAAQQRLNATMKRSAATASTYSAGPPSLKITGETVTNQVVDTSKLTLLAVHTSLPLVRVLKGLNDFSNNWMARAIGRFVGGPEAVQRFLETEIGLSGEELNIVTASGLGTNLISPRGTARILRKLIAYLEKERLGLEEILPVAGVDAGTLEKRFTDAYRGSVVAKTGTLRSVSALAGVAHTRTRGPLLFVIYNRGGAPYTFRAVQDETIKKVITFFGGPAAVRYSPNGGPQISERASEANNTPALMSPK